LLAAIAQEGFELLAANMDRIHAETLGQPEYERLLTLSSGYVSFAVEHPHHFQLMFGPLDQSKHPALFEASMAALGKLIEAVAEAQAHGVVREGPPPLLATTLWYTIHGIASVWIARKIPPNMLEDASPEEFARPHVENVLNGLAAST
ncbi:MAG: TetR-like C-terminal domain-containing protein, partial [Chloroflexota bacterium]